MGFQSECQGLIDRYIQVDGAWDEHLARTRAFIANAVSGKKIKNLAVLGSGWLLDLPLEELAAVSGHVWLYDALHPAQVIHRLSKYNNVSAISVDITGSGMVNVWKAVRQYRRTGKKASPESFCNAKFRADEVPDYVISLNLLSQIGVMITGYLQQHIPYTREEVEKINRLLQQAHLELLEPDKSCLVTDIRETNIDLTGGQAESSELLQVLLPDKPQQTNLGMELRSKRGIQARQKNDTAGAGDGNVIEISQVSLYVTDDFLQRLSFLIAFFYKTWSGITQRGYTVYFLVFIKIKCLSEDGGIIGFNPAGAHTFIFSGEDQVCEGDCNISFKGSISVISPHPGIIL